MKNILTLGLLLLGIISCEPEPPDCDYRFVILNSSDYHVDFKVFYLNADSISKDSLFSLNSHNEIKFEYINYIPGNAFNLPVDSVYITFDNTKRIVYKKDDANPRNILMLDSYENGSENKYWYRFQYNITNEDYESALVLVRARL